MNIAIVGTGYVGLVSGACFAEMGNNVTCVDIDREKIAKLLRGEMPIYEPGLDDLVARNVREGRLRFTTDIRECLDSVEMVFSAVGTPPDEDGSADLTTAKIAALMREMFEWIAEFEGEIPGATPRDCGNYSFNDLEGAKVRARRYAELLAHITPEQLSYPE